MDELTIGRMAKLNCVSEKALRLYHMKGILEPARTDEETGYRYYDLGQCATVDMIQQLRILGFTLDEIKAIEEARDVEFFFDVLQKRRAGIAEQERHLAIAHKVADDLISHCDTYLHRPLCNQIILEHLPPRTVLKFANENPHLLTTYDGREAMDNWELTLRSIKRVIVERGWPISLFRSVGCIIPRERLAAGDLRFESSFVFVDEAFGEAFEAAEVLPGGDHLTMYCAGATTERGEDAETVLLERMLDYARHKHFAIAGDYVGEVIADTPEFLFERRDMFFKLCLPVRYDLCTEGAA